MATEQFAPIIEEQIKKLPKENLLFEPARRDNGPAIILGMTQIKEIDPEATVAILWSDHLIQKKEVLVETLKGAFQCSIEHPKSMITIGAKPTSADPGLGYIQMGEVIGRYDNTWAFKVDKFIEKPDAKTAQAFVNQWQFFWNVGYKIIQVGQFFESIETANKDLLEPIKQLTKEISKPKIDKNKIGEIYELLPKTSIEYILTQYLKEMIVLPADIGWSDIGNWDTLHEVLKEFNGLDLIIQGPVETVSTQNCLIYSKDRLICAVGVRDLVIVDDGDALLVMSKTEAHQIKTLTAQLEINNKQLT